MKMIIRVPKMISKEIKTAKDLNDYYAYEERYGDDITYDWESVADFMRIEKLIESEDFGYCGGVYDEENVRRIIHGGIR